MRIANLSDNELVNEINCLRGNERKVLLSLLHHLIELDKRKLYRDYGHGSLHCFLTERLGYSDASAGRRVRAARAICEHPELGPKLLSGEVTLCVLSTVSHTLRNEPKREEKEKLVQSLSFCSKREAEALVAERNPKSLLRESVKPVVVKLSPSQLFSDSSTGERIDRTEVEKRYRISFSASEQCMEKLNQVKALASNRGVSHKLEALFDALLEEYLRRHSPMKRATRRKDEPKAAKSKNPSKNSRYVNAKLKDQVFLRDGCRCSYVGKDGRRCSQTEYLQIDHITPIAIGGKSELGNLRLLCSAHNQLEAERVFGREVIESIRTSVS